MARATCPDCGCPEAELLFQTPRCPSPLCRRFDFQLLNAYAKPAVIRVLVWAGARAREDKAQLYELRRMSQHGDHEGIRRWAQDADL